MSGSATWYSGQAHEMTCRQLSAYSPRATQIPASPGATAPKVTISLHTNQEG
jgi:hypothetical protein